MPSALPLIGLVLTVWVGIDANRRDWQDYRFCNRTWKWVVGSLLIPLITFLVYLHSRKRVPLKNPTSA
jgi:hypothetical protein